MPASRSPARSATRRWSHFLRPKFHLDEAVLPVRLLGYWAKGGCTATRRLACHPEAGDRADPREAASRSSLRRWRSCRAFVIGITAGVVSGGEEGYWWDYGANGFALWGLSTPTLARHPPHPVLRGAARLAARLGLCQPVRGPSKAKPRVDDHAGVRARQRVRRRAHGAITRRRDAPGALFPTMCATARAKGLDERVVVLSHALRNALIPVITLGALGLGELLGGAVLTEQVFTIPGFGKLIVDAVFQSRLFGRARGRALHRDGVHHAQPARRPRLFPRQPRMRH